MAIYKELLIDQGSTFRYQVSLSDINDDTAFDLSNFTVTSHIKKTYKSLNPAAIFTTAFANNDPTNGAIELGLTDEETASLAPGRYMFDVVIESNTGAIYRVVEGLIEVNPGITLPTPAT